MKTNVDHIATTRPIRTKTQKVYVEGWELLAKAKRLAMEGRREEVITEVRRFSKKAMFYHFNKLSSEFAGYLQYYYIMNGDTRRGRKYAELRDKYNQLAHYENLVEFEFSKITYKLNSTRQPTAQLRKELDELCIDLKKYLQYDSAPIYIFIYSLMIANAYIKNDNQQGIVLAHEIINYLEKRGIERTSYFYKDLTSALINERRYDEAIIAINKAISSIPKGSNPWSVYIYYKFVIAIHQQQYENAYVLFLDAKKKRYINKPMREQWAIVKGYITFLIRSGNINNPLSSSFRLGKFLNEVPIFSKDKAGNNVNILILKIILNLNNNRDKIIDERDAIKRYAERYLSSGSRERIFLEMLLQVPLGDFDPDKIRKRTTIMLKELEVVPASGQDIEVVPFDVLWKMVLKYLKEK